MHSLWKSWPQHSVRKRPPRSLACDDDGVPPRLHGIDLRFAIGERQMLQATGEAAPEEAMLAAPLPLSECRPTGLEVGVANTEPRDSAKRLLRVIKGEAAPEAGAEPETLLATETVSARSASSRWFESRSFSAAATTEADGAAGAASCMTTTPSGVESIRESGG